jgi:hypothetical protein
LTGTKAANDDEEEVQLAADYHETATARVLAGTEQTRAGGLPGCRYFAAELKGECLNQEIFYRLKEAQFIVGQWRNHYNTIRSLSSLNYRPAARQTLAPLVLHLDELTPMQ